MALCVHGIGSTECRACRSGGDRCQCCQLESAYAHGRRATSAYRHIHGRRDFYAGGYRHWFVHRPLVHDADAASRASCCPGLIRPAQPETNFSGVRVQRRAVKPEQHSSPFLQLRCPAWKALIGAVRKQRVGASPGGAGAAVELIRLSVCLAGPRPGTCLFSGSRTPACRLPSSRL